MPEKTFAEEAGLPEMNITHTHTEVAKNDIEDIIKAIYENIGLTEDPTNGHSPMDRLVVAVALFCAADPGAALSQGNYPNQMKRIAAIIRGEFNDSGSGGGEEN